MKSEEVKSSTEEVTIGLWPGPVGRHLEIDSEVLSILLPVEVEVARKRSNQRPLSDNRHGTDFNTHGIW